MAFELHPAQPVALITFAQCSCAPDSRSPVSQRDLRALLLGTLVLPFSLSDLLLVLWTQVKNNLSRVVSLKPFHAGAFFLSYTVGITFVTLFFTFTCISSEREPACDVASHL